jgi:hypothetical protein
MAIETITSDFIRNENSASHYGVHLANYMNECNLTGEDLLSKFEKYNFLFFFNEKIQFF